MPNVGRQNARSGAKRYPDARNRRDAEHPAAIPRRFVLQKETAYEQTEAEIVQGYMDAKIPIYWSALEAVTGSPHVLYFDGFDNFADIERSGADLAQGLDAHPEIGTAQQKLADLVAATRTVLAFRRDDLGYRLNKINLAKTNFVRVAI